MSQLTNCPFCNSNKVGLTSIAKNQYGKRHIKYQGLCNKCHARGPVVTVTCEPRKESQAEIQLKQDKAKSMAISLWNQRQP